MTLTQKMKLTTPPLQRQIRSLENHTIASSPIKWNLKSSELVFKLHIDPLGHNSGLSATLYLQKQPKSIASSEIVTAELTLHQKSSPSVTLHQKSSPSKPKAPSQLKLFQCLLVMDMPDAHTSARYPLAVARFPTILSHKHLMNSSLITCTALDLSLTLTHLNSS